MPKTTRAKITKKLVDATAPDADDRVIVWDTEIAGFNLLVSPTGVKSYRYRYRSSEGDERHPTIGKHGAITPDEARARAKQWQAVVFAGGDPLRDRQERRNAATIGDVLDAYLGSVAFAAKAVSTRLTDKGRIERHLKPLLGRRPVDTLTQEDIERAFNAIRDGKTARVEKVGFRAVSRVRGGEGAARKCVRLLRSILAWAIRERLAKTNPADGVRTGSDGSRDTILDDAEAYARLFRTLDNMETEGRIRQPVADAIRVIAVTGARRGEVVRLCWRHVDLRAATITLPPAAHKTGTKTGKPRVIGLPAAAQALIARQPHRSEEDFVFEPAHGVGPINLTKIWDKIRREAELPEGIGVHGLRHSVASHMAMEGAQASEIMAALGHRNITTSQKYVHWVEARRQPLAEKAAATALAGLAIATGKPNATVYKIGGDK